MKNFWLQRRMKNFWLQRRIRRIDHVVSMYGSTPIHLAENYATLLEECKTNKKTAQFIRRRIHMDTPIWVGDRNLTRAEIKELMEVIMKQV